MAGADSQDLTSPRNQGTKTRLAVELVCNFRGVIEKVWGKNRKDQNAKLTYGSNWHSFGQQRGASAFEVLGPLCNPFGGADEDSFASATRCVTKPCREQLGVCQNRCTLRAIGSLLVSLYNQEASKNQPQLGETELWMGCGCSQACHGQAVSTCTLGWRSLILLRHLWCQRALA